MSYSLIVHHLVAIKENLVNTEFSGAEHIYLQVIPDHDTFIFSGMYSTQGLVEYLGPGFIMANNFRGCKTLKILIQSAILHFNLLGGKETIGDNVELVPVKKIIQDLPGMG